jgi:hypothetical protein
MTSITEEELLALLPYVEQAFVSDRQDPSIDEHPRTSRPCSTYETSPVPTLADKLLFILTDLQQRHLAVVSGKIGASREMSSTVSQFSHPRKKSRGGELTPIDPHSNRTCHWWGGTLRNCAR